jgi:predicted DNA-binding transcriptional regulator AlpA
MTPKSPRLLDLRKVTAEYGGSYAVWYSLIAKGLLPKVEFPGHRRIFVRREDLDRLIEQNTERVA